LNKPLRLKHCSNGRIASERLDVKTTVVTYNLCFWIRSNYAYVFLPTNEPSVAVVGYDGSYEIYSSSCAEDLDVVLDQTLGVNEDLSCFHRLARKDPLLGDFASGYPGWRLRSTSLWWALVTGICQQNASFKQGWGILHKIVLMYGKKALLREDEVLIPPTPRDVLERPSLLIEAGAGYRAKVIVDTARAVVEELESDVMNASSASEVERALRRIKGVGPYTARLAIVLALRMYELPPVDRWLKKIISLVYGIDENYAESYWAQKWSGFAGLASVAATIALDAEPLTRALERVRHRKLLPSPHKSPTPINMVGFCEKLSLE